MKKIPLLDFNKFKAIYKIGKDLSLSDILIVANAARKKSYDIGECLVKEGDTRKAVFFILKGLIRSYQINNKGEEITTGLFFENDFFCSPFTVFFSEPAQSYYVALERTTVFSMDYEKLDALIAKNPQLEANRKLFYHAGIKEMIKRINSFVLLSPEERYLDFVQKKPELVNRVPDKFIANVLGITPVSLSRIRKRIADKRKNKTYTKY